MASNVHASCRAADAERGPWWTVALDFLWVMALLVLAGCGGGGSDEPAAPAPPSVASVVVSDLGGALAVGQSRTLTAQARDSQGRAIAGSTFTWSSSNASVATVTDGVVTGVAAGSATITARSGGVSSAPVSVTVNPPPRRLVIDRPWAFFTAVGQTLSLSASQQDAQGATLSAAGATWSSSAPDKVAVDGNGQLLALAIGSAQITAELGGVRSAPTLVVVAEPKPGALVLNDAQIVSVGPLSGATQGAAGTAGGVGAEYEVTLQGLSTPPAAGTVLLAAESAPVAGKVVSTRTEAAGLVVRVAVAPLYELLERYDLRFNLDLAAFPMQAAPERTAGGPRSAALWQPRSRAKASEQRRLADDDALQPFRAWKCEAEVKAKLLGEPPIQLRLAQQLNLVVEDRPGYSKHALEGSATITGSAGFKLSPQFDATGTCEAQAQIKLPVAGWVSAIVMPAVRFGVGAELSGKALVVQAELGVEGSVGVNTSLGWECGGAETACRGLDRFDITNNFKTKSSLPRTDEMQVAISAHIYALAGLDASILMGLRNAELVEAKYGPKQSFNLAIEQDQLTQEDYASSYELTLEGAVEPGSALKRAIKAVINDDAVGVSFSGTLPSRKLSESPKGTLQLDRTRVNPGAEVEFTVDFVPLDSVAYWLLGYNVVGVELYRKRDDETDFSPWKSMTLVSSHRATYRWTPQEADSGKYEFAALVNTQLPTPLLEVQPASIRRLEVSCFSGNAKPLAAARAAQAAVCADTWSGTSTFIIQTPTLPGDNITARAQITWLLDATRSDSLATYYKASGSFELAFSSTHGCTYTLSPNRFTIVDDPRTPSTLVTSTVGTSPQYSFTGKQLVSFTVTTTCPDREPVVTEHRNFLVAYAIGRGPYSPGQTTLAGQFDDGEVASTWSFSRP